jgi:CDP-glucose 4,6-dehydratase
MFNKLKNTYSDKKVFITGHTGFKGSWLLKILSMMGAEVFGYALEPENKLDIYNLINGDSICKSEISDLRDSTSLKKSILHFQPDFIFHLAAQPLVRLSYEIPAETFEVNAIGTANLLDAVRLLEKPCSIVLITTDKVYFNNEWVYPYRETDRLGGYDPYSASKACAELIIDSYRNCFFNTQNYSSHKKAIAVARAGNVIGGGDWSKDRLIPDIVRALAKKETIFIRNPKSIRPWQHVLEPLFGYLLLGLNLEQHPLKFSEAFNFGPTSDNALPVSEMVCLAINAWGSGHYECMENLHQPHEAGLLKLDISKVTAEMSWKPILNAMESVEKTIDWYKMFNYSPESIIAFTEEQIKSFSNG